MSFSNQKNDEKFTTNYHAVVGPIDLCEASHVPFKSSTGRLSESKHGQGRRRDCAAAADFIKIQLKRNFYSFWGFAGSSDKDCLEIRERSGTS